VSKRSRLTVGIDLGTTHVVVAWARTAADQTPDVFAIPQWVARGEVGERTLLPSFLYAPIAEEAQSDPWQDTPWIIGEHARRRGREVPGRLVASAKSWLCHGAVDRTAAILPWGSDGADDLPRVSPVQASANLLRHVRRAWDQARPEHPLDQQQVVLTVPASFDQAARELTLESARQAGLTVRLLEEPQAAFYDAMQRIGSDELGRLADRHGGRASVVVCDVGGGTSDFTLIQLTRAREGALGVSRTAVGRHLLLGGDNMDLALAHLCESRLAGPAERLGPQRFAQLVAACRAAKERLLGPEPPEQFPVAVAGSGSALVGATLRTELERDEVRQVVLDGFFARAERDSKPGRQRSGLVGFGLPYEREPAITRHLASFLTRHASDTMAPDAILLNGGVFRSKSVVSRLLEVLGSWGDQVPEVLTQSDPDLAVARGAVTFGLAVSGHGITIGGGAPHGYYVGLDAQHDPNTSGRRRAMCVVPRGAREGERHVARAHPLALRVGRAVRFDLFASDTGKAHAPGEIVLVDEDRFQRLPAVTMRFESEATEHGSEVGVALEGELSAIGTLELACVETEPGEREPRHFRLAFELRSTSASPDESGSSGGGATTRQSERARAARGRLDAARDAIDRVFGKRRQDVKTRETKDLVRELERLLGPRHAWTTDVTRSLFDAVAPGRKARRRSPDHERVFWMIAGYCLRPGFGHPRDRERIALLVPLFREGLTYGQESRGWQQFFIAWRRVAAGLGESMQAEIRAKLDPFLAPSDSKLKKPKGFKPLAPEELLELASWLERIPAERRGLLGRWILDRTWTDRDPRLWSAIGRLGARVPVYASVHHVVPPRTVERWLDHLLREKWNEMPSAAAAALQLARVTDDRARDISPALREEVAKRMEQISSRAEWIEAVREFVPIAAAERAEFYGEDLPVGLRLLDLGENEE
jgi:molecular chaperone DnaK (HSP70)